MSKTMRPDVDQPTKAQIDAGRKDEHWPDDSRIDAIGQNGNTGEHYNDMQDLPIGAFNPVFGPRDYIMPGSVLSNETLSEQLSRAVRERVEHIKREDEQKAKAAIERGELKLDENGAPYVVTGQTVKLRRPMPPVLQPQSLSVQFLNRCAEVQQERGKQYDKAPAIAGGTKVERSFQRTARAFNAITGKNLRGSEVALVLQLLKDVRQWQNPEAPHVDSLLDGVSYASLKAEEFMLESGQETLP